MKKEIIYKEDALKALTQCHKYCIDPFDSYHIDIEDAEARIRRVPPAQPKRKRVSRKKMTKEEAIIRIKNHIEIHKYKRNAIKIFEALDMAIKALEQPDIPDINEIIDAIKDAINMLTGNEDYMIGVRNGMRWCWSALTNKWLEFEDIPSVQPERKKGHWIYHRDEFDGETVECSVCHAEGMLHGNYCPHCGAKMDEKDGDSK